MTEPEIRGELANKESLLVAAIEGVSELFVLWDADDRLVICNAGFRELNAQIIEFIQPGNTFEQHIRAVLAHGLAPEAAEREQEWLAERLRRHRNPGPPFEMQRQDGRWLLVHEQRLPDGGIATIGTDISERKRVEEQLKLRERQLSEAQRIGRIGHWTWDRDQDLFEASEALCRIYGLPADTPLTFRAITDAIHEDDRDWAERNRDAAVAERRGYDFSFRIRRLDGEVRYVEGRTSPRLNDADEIVGFFGVTQDVTERRWAENALRQRTKSLELLQTVASAANEASSVETAIQICIDEVCAYTGWPVGHAYIRASDGDALLPMDIWHLADPDRFDGFRQATREIRLVRGIGLPGRILDSGQPTWVVDVQADSNFPRARAAADIGVRAAFGFPVLSGRDVVAVLEFFSGDVAEPDQPLLEIMAQVGIQLGRVIERTEAAEALLEERARLETILDLAPDAIIVVDGERRIRRYSQGAADIFGYATEEALDQPLEFLLPARFRDAHGGQVSDFAESPNSSRRMGQRSEVVGLRRDGSEFPAEAAIAKIPLARETLFVVVLRDISARKQREEQLRQSQKMEAIGQLTGGIAHDFNNLLAIIQGSIAILDRKLEDGSEHKALTQPALRTAKRGASLTKRLLAFSRDQSLDVGSVDVAELIDGLGEMLARSLGEDIAVETVVGAELWACKADGGELEQAIVNLANNGRDAMPEGGRLTIRVQNLSMQADDVARPVEVVPGDYVVIEVADTGYGVSDEVKSRIFEPFFTTKEVGRGTGLGLSMVYGFVRQSGGHVGVESEAGLGTTFQLYLPRLAAASGEAEGEEDGSGQVLGESVLVVEDDDDLRAMTRMLLEDLGYRVFEAESGPKALAVMQSSGPIDLLLTDIVLPGGMSGLEIAKQGRRAMPFLKVVFMSGYGDDAITRPEVLDDDVPMLRKPFDPDDLGGCLRAVLDGG